MKHMLLMPPVISGLILFGCPAPSSASTTTDAGTDSLRSITVEPNPDSCTASGIPALRQTAWEQLAQFDTRRLPEKNRETWEAYQRANALVLDQQWKQAAEAMAEVERKYPRSEWADDARFWHAYSLEKNGAPLEEVFRKYEDFLKVYANSKWADASRSSLIGIGNRLAASGKPEYAEKIRPFTESDKTDIALTALVALQNMGDDSLPDIMKLYNTTSDPAIRERIVSSLSVVRSPGAIDFLIHIAETDSSATMRRKALIQLSACMFKSESMRMSLQSSAAPFQSAAIPSADAVSIFTAPNGVYSGTFPSSAPGRMKNELSEQDRNKISAAIRKIARTDSNDDIRRSAINLISQTVLQDDDIRFLETIVSNDPNPDLRRNALAALFRLPENRGIPSVIAVAKSNSHTQIRKTAIQFLGSSKDPRARAALVEIASGK